VKGGELVTQAAKGIRMGCGVVGLAKAGVCNWTENSVKVGVLSSRTVNSRLANVSTVLLRDNDGKGEETKQHDATLNRVSGSNCSHSSKDFTDEDEGGEEEDAGVSADFLVSDGLDDVSKGLELDYDEHHGTSAAKKTAHNPQDFAVEAVGVKLVHGVVIPRDKHSTRDGLKRNEHHSHNPSEKEPPEGEKSSISSFVWDSHKDVSGPNS